MARRFRVDDRLGVYGPAVAATLSQAGWKGPDAFDLWWVAPGSTATPTTSEVGTGLITNHGQGQIVLTSNEELFAVTERARRSLDRLGMGDRAAPAPRTWWMPGGASEVRAASHPNGDLRWVRRPRSGESTAAPEPLASLDAIDQDSPCLIQERVVPEATVSTTSRLLLYVLLVGPEPLRVYLHRSGLVLPPHELVEADASVEPQTLPLDLGDCVSQWRDEGINTSELWRDIQWVLTTTIATARAPILNARTFSETADGFALFQAEVLVGEGWRPWVMGFREWPPGSDEPLAPAAHEQTSRVLKDVLRVLGVLEPSATADAAITHRHWSDGAFAEFERAASFVRLVPSADPMVFALLEEPHPSEITLARMVSGIEGSSPARRLRPWRTSTYVLDDRAVLYSEVNRSVFVLNRTATYIWLALEADATIDEVAAELTRAFAHVGEGIVDDVWTIIASWLRAGLLRPDFEDGSNALGGRDELEEPAAPTEGPSRGTAESGYVRRRWNSGERVYDYLGHRVCIRFPDDRTEGAVHATLRLLEVPGAASFESVLEIQRAPTGYRLVVDDHTNTELLDPSDLAIQIHHELATLSYRALAVVLAVRATLLAGRTSVVLIGLSPDLAARLAVELEPLGVKVEVEAPLLLRPPVGFVRHDRTLRALTAPAVVVVDVQPTEPTSIYAMAGADALERLLTADVDALDLLDGPGTARLVDAVRSMQFFRLALHDVPTAIQILARLATGIAPE